MKHLDIAIAGCGPTGLASALLLARDGHRVTMFERFETPRPLGSGLMIQPTGQAVLRALGPDHALLARGARIERLIGKTARGRTVLDVRYRALGRRGGIGIGVHRARLFELLYNAVRVAGVAVTTNRHIAACDRDARGRRRLRFADGTSADPFDLVVDALGSRSPLAPPVGRNLAYGALWATLDWRDADGFDAESLEQRYRAAREMVGVLPIGTMPGDPIPKLAFFWSLRADAVDRWRDDGLDRWKQTVLDLWPATDPLLARIDNPGHLAFARYAHRTLRVPAEPGLIHLGDAWHSASPQLGQGANMALLDAYALALGLRAHDDLDAALAHTVALRRRHVRLYQALTAIFTPVYQSDGRVIPFVRDALVGPVSRLWPIERLQAMTVGGLLGSPLKRLGL